ncbi:MAG TPA: AsnC family transcriptional regulator [Planctomycetota bacterium]|nr:AsnC family transcriptional regulator [Planctomycetota bacterium]
MDDTDLVILKTVQKAFPLSTRPYDVLAQELGLSADEVHRRVSVLRRTGVIRRIGPLFDSRHLGFRGHLVAARVEPDAVNDLAALLDRHDGVTHNYLRSGPLNVWFTVTLKETDDLERVLAEVRAEPGVGEVVTFPTRKVFKLDASFTVRDNDG